MSAFPEVLLRLAEAQLRSAEAASRAFNSISDLASTVARAADAAHDRMIEIDKNILGLVNLMRAREVNGAVAKPSPPSPPSAATTRHHNIDVRYLRMPYRITNVIREALNIDFKDRRQISVEETLALKAIPYFGHVSFVDLMTALAKAGVSREELQASALWRSGRSKSIRAAINCIEGLEKTP